MVAMTTTKCVRGREYAIRVDLKKTDFVLGPLIAKSANSEVYRGTVDGQPAVIKKPNLPTKCGACAPCRRVRSSFPAAAAHLRPLRPAEPFPNVSIRF